MDLFAYYEFQRWRGYFQGAMWCILAMGVADLGGIADLHYQKVKNTKWLKTQTEP